MRDARDGYVRWGALAKVRALEARLPEFQRSLGASHEVALDWSQLEGFDLGRVPQLVESGLLDLSTVWKATQAISGEATRERLLEKLMGIVKESAGAQRSVLVLRESDDAAAGLLVQAESGEAGAVRLLEAEPVERHGGLPVSLIRYVMRTNTSVVLNDAAAEGAFTKDPYIASRRPQSVLAMPIVHQGQAAGVLYLENNVLTDAFTPERLAVLQILAGQAAVSLQNVRAVERAAYLEAERTIKDTYARELEARVDERTAELTQAYGQLMELDRLKTNFLNVVSHELRTPLTTIQGYAEFLEDRTGGDLTGDQDEFVRQIQLGTVQLKRLVDDLLDFARVEAGAFSLVLAHADMRQTMADAVESLQPILREHGLALTLDLPAEPVWTQADAGRVAQVVLNLVGNAVKFTPRNGAIAVSLKALSGELRVEVKDSGIGIAPQHLPKLFQKFFQVDSSSTREKGGVGLGLSIAQSIVEAHGGQIGVESTAGEGSTFWFTLPRTAEPTPGDPPAAAETQSLR
jgi:signal transduction histidine kinase